MRVFVTGASGALGSRLVPQLIDAGHEVVGTHNSPASAELLRTLGAKPLLVDLLDVRAVRKAVLDNEPEAIVHEATALGKAKFGRNFDKAFAMTNQLRTKGTDALLAAAREAGVRRFVAQSFAPTGTSGRAVRSRPRTIHWTRRHRRIPNRAGRRWPISTRRSPTSAESLCAMAASTALPTTAGPSSCGSGCCRSSVTAAATSRGSMSRTPQQQPSWRSSTRGRQIYNIVDDEPAPVRECLPVLAKSLGAKPPRHFPVWLARLLAGETAVVMATEVRGASNAKAKRELGWTLRYPSWRTGFPAVYSATHRGRLTEASSGRTDQPIGWIRYEP